MPAGGVDGSQALLNNGTTQIAARRAMARHPLGRPHIRRGNRRIIPGNRRVVRRGTVVGRKNVVVRNWPRV